jgi:hypothetical protein
MKLSFPVTLVMASWGLLAACNGCSQTPTSSGSPLASLTRAETFEQAASAYAESFRSRNGASADEFLHSADTTTAVHAAWLRCRRQRVRNDAAICSPSRFLGFLEARMQVELPLRWEVALIARALGGLADDASLIEAAWRPYQGACPELQRIGPGGDYLLRGYPLWKNSSGFLSPPDVRVDRDGDVLTIQQGKMTIRLAHGVTSHEVDRKDHCVVTLGPQRSFIGFYDAFAESYPLICVRTVSGDLIWKRKVLAIGGELLASKRFGPYGHNVAMMLSGDTVAVFGDDEFSCYVEAFSVATGERVFRFCTDYALRDYPAGGFPMDGKRETSPTDPDGL